MTPREAAEIATATIGRKTWCEGVAGAWYLTSDQDDNTSGMTYPNVADAVRDIVRVAGFVLFPDAWSEEQRLAILPQCHPGEGFLLRIQMPDAAGGSGNGRGACAGVRR